MLIRAAVLHGVKEPFRIEEVELSAPKRGEVRIKMAATGVCHSDWHVVTGDTTHPLPAVLGHEGAGVVEEVGQGVTRVKVGDHVALNWAPSCGACFYCLKGRPNLCDAFVGPVWVGTMTDGTTRLSQYGQPIYHFSALACFAEQSVVPEPCCIPLSKEIPFPIAALIGCAVTTGVGAVLNTAQVERGSSVAVYGCGGVGLSVVLGARLADADRIIAVDQTAEKLDLAKSFGADFGIISGNGDVDAIRDLTEGRGADYVFEAAGIPALQERSLLAARPGGTVVLAGISPMGSATNLPGAILTRQEKTVMGSYYGTSDPARDFPAYADLYSQGRLDLDRLITRTYRLEEINEAYADMLSGRIARGVVVY